MERLYPTGPVEDLIRQMFSLQRFNKKETRRFEELTGREVEILSLIAEGLNNPAVATKLGISRATVQNHRARIRDKLNIESQADFIKYGLAYDLIQF